MNWIDLPAPPSDARIVHVALDGSDTNDGYSPGSPLRTIAAGLARMRHGFPDRLLLRRGDVFSGLDIPTGGVRWKTSGRSADAPTVFGSYGNLALPRPRLVTDGRAGFEVRGGGGTPPLIEHLAIMGIEFDAGVRSVDPAGIRLQLDMSDVLIEDVKVKGFLNGLTAQVTGGVIRGLAVRGSVFHDCYSVGNAHAQGIYCDEVDGLLVESCVIDNVGMNHPDIFMHGLYIQGDARNVVVRDNVIMRASSHGAQLRSGGVFDRNLVVNCAIGVLLAGDGQVTRNVITEARDILPTLPRRFAVDVQAVPNGARVAENLFVHTPASTTARGVQIQPLEYPAGTFLGSSNVVTERNVMYQWSGPGYRVSEPPGAAPGSSIHAGLLERENRWDADETPEDLVGPISLADYAVRCGLGSTIPGLAAELVRQSRETWRSELSGTEIVAAFRRGYAPLALIV